MEREDAHRGAEVHLHALRRGRGVEYEACGDRSQTEDRRTQGNTDIGRHSGTADRQTADRAREGETARRPEREASIDSGTQPPAAYRQDERATEGERTARYADLTGRINLEAVGNRRAVQGHRSHSGVELELERHPRKGETDTGQRALNGQVDGRSDAPAALDLHVTDDFEIEDSERQGRVGVQRECRRSRRQPEVADEAGTQNPDGGAEPHLRNRHRDGGVDQRAGTDICQGEAWQSRAHRHRQGEIGDQASEADGE